MKMLLTKHDLYITLLILTFCFYQLDKIKKYLDRLFSLLDLETTITQI